MGERERKVTFSVYFAGERAAGLNPFSDTITIGIESGDPGGEAGEFAEHMRQALAEWFDGATVEPSTEYWSPLAARSPEPPEEREAREALRGFIAWVDGPGAEVICFMHGTMKEGNEQFAKLRAALGRVRAKEPR